MDNLSAIILGLVQGLTEFLPVSSSGHLVFTEKILSTKASAELTFEVLLHLSTLIAVIVYFRVRLLRMFRSLLRPSDPASAAELRMALYIVIATIPAAIAGLLFEKNVEQAFNSAKITSIFLLFTGFILLMTGLVKKGNRPITFGSGLLIGVAQALALFPGISRSGMTISAGLFQKIIPQEAAEFSFLLSIPAILGAVVLKTPKLLHVFDTANLDHYAFGCLAALISGYLSISFLLKIIGKGKFFYFGLYCLAMGIVGIAIL